MRTNLQCPFQDKDLAKQRGARWDPQLRVWYVQDVEDLSPFAAWLPPASAPAGQPAPARQTRAAVRPTGKTPLGTVSGPLGARALALAGCHCNVLPWEDCDCTRRLSVPAH